MQPLGKYLIILGIIIVGIGVLVMAFSNIPVIGKLPGDIKFKKDNFEIYIPLTTSILLSILISVILWIVSFFSKK